MKVLYVIYQLTLISATKMEMDNKNLQGIELESETKKINCKKLYCNSVAI